MRKEIHLTVNLEYFSLSESSQFFSFFLTVKFTYTSYLYYRTQWHRIFRSGLLGHWTTSRRVKVLSMTKTRRAKSLYATFLSFSPFVTRMRSWLSQYFFFFDRPTRNRISRRNAWNAWNASAGETKEDREMTRYREASVELFSPVESGVTVAVPYAARCTALCAWEPNGKFKVGYIFSARQAH